MNYTTYSTTFKYNLINEVKITYPFLLLLSHGTDIALGILRQYPNLAIARDEQQQTALHILAKKSRKSSKDEPGLWRRFGNFCRLTSSIYSLFFASFPPLRMLGRLIKLIPAFMFVFSYICACSRGGKPSTSSSY